MKNPRPALLIGLLVACAALVGLAPDDRTAATQPATASAPACPPGRFNAQLYLAHVQYLAGDECAGRRPGTPGIEKAAEYIAQQFAAAGLAPLGDDGTYFQEFEVSQGRQIDEDAAELTVEEVDRVWRVGQDWIPLPFSGSEEVEGPLAFAGYGIRAPEHDYNDFEELDARDKVLLVLRYEPVAEDPNAEFGGRTHSRHAMFQRKIRAAKRAGAKGLLIVNPPGRPEEDQLFAFDSDLARQGSDLAVAHITRALAEELLEEAGLQTLAELTEKLDKERKPLSEEMGLNVVLNPGLVARQAATRNVVGRLAGAGDTDDTIVVGAHYDHLGPAGGSKDAPARIYYGADDNASGTAGVIELARILGGEKLRRDVVFVAFSAEEMGLLGSRHFVEEPPVALDEIRAMVNLDMIGRYSLKKFAIFGAHSAPELEAIIARAAEARGIEYKAPRGGGGGGSDHASFARHEIPSLFAFTGIHKQYHQPEDTWDLIDAPGAACLLDMFADVVRDLANLESGPTFRRESRRERPEEEAPIKPGVEHEREAAEREAAGDDAASQPATRPARPGRPGGDEDDVERPRRPRVQLGVVPDYAGNKPGLVVESVIEGGPAQTAGVQAGDRIVRIGDQEIKDIYDYMRALGQHKGGDVVDIVVSRKSADKEEELTLKATLKEGGRRPSRE
ncbi:MAG: M20/M25/M40 family metallo-hydrolase [Planctomycetota bacterium]